MAALITGKIIFRNYFNDFKSVSFLAAMFSKGIHTGKVFNRLFSQRNKQVRSTRYVETIYYRWSEAVISYESWWYLLECYRRYWYKHYYDSLSSNYLMGTKSEPEPELPEPEPRQRPAQLCLPLITTQTPCTKAREKRSVQHWWHKLCSRYCYAGTTLVALGP